MQVVATERGFDGITLREVGEEFAAPKDAKGVPIAKAKWYKPVEPKQQPPRKESGSDLT